MIRSSKLPVGGTRNGNDATRSACERKQHWHSEQCQLNLAERKSGALAVAANGRKLPPTVIFKGVRTPRDLVVLHPLGVSFHKKGWMDEQGVRE